MAKIRLVCWKQDLAVERARSLEESGFSVDASPLHTGGMIGQLRADRTGAVLIDLDRLPSHGREVAIALRNSKTTRYIPIVFAGGLEQKVERIRAELPDAAFTSWSGVARVLKKAMRGAPVEPVQPQPHMRRYAGSSLTKKLGLAPNLAAALIGAPAEFAQNLGELPEGVAMQSRIDSGTKLAIWFVRSRHELESETELICARLPPGSSIWIVHPKQAGRYRVDFNQNDVRAAGLAAGLVDYKVCSVDADWSGVKFTHRKRYGAGSPPGR